MPYVPFLARFSNAVAAGAIANSLAIWATGAVGLTAAMGAAIAPDLTPAWFYPRLVWGGIWGLLFLLPIRIEPLWLKGLVWSLGPSTVQLFVVFPSKTDAGVLGFGLGGLTFVVVLVTNALWGLTAAAWIDSTHTRD